MKMKIDRTAIRTQYLLCSSARNPVLSGTLLGSRVSAPTRSLVPAKVNKKRMMAVAPKHMKVFCHACGPEPKKLTRGSVTTLIIIIPIMAMIMRVRFSIDRSYWFWVISAVSVP